MNEIICFKYRRIYIMIKFQQTGYHGFSMSERAWEAYGDGRYPYSQWNRYEIYEYIETIEDIEIVTKIKSYPLNVLKEYFLVKTEWHHTSKYANCTDFYAFNEDLLDDVDFEELDYIHKCSLADRKKDSIIKLVLIDYEVWVGTRNYGRYKHFEKFGLQIDNQIYLPDGSRKRANGCHIQILNVFDKLPVKFEEDYDSILKRLPKSAVKKLKKCNFEIVDKSSCNGLTS